MRFIIAFTILVVAAVTVQAVVIALAISGDWSLVILEAVLAVVLAVVWSIAEVFD